MSEHLCPECGRPIFGTIYDGVCVNEGCLWMTPVDEQDTHVQMKPVSEEQVTLKLNAAEKAVEILKKQSASNEADEDEDLSYLDQYTDFDDDIDEDQEDDIEELEVEVPKKPKADPWKTLPVRYPQEFITRLRNHCKAHEIPIRRFVQAAIEDHMSVAHATPKPSNDGKRGWFRRLF